MAIPSKKSPEITSFLNTLGDRSASIELDRCVAPPIGCGGPAKEFKDELSRKEYTISGFCQECQDKIFG